MKKASFDRLWYVKRRQVSDRIKCDYAESRKSWFHNGDGCEPPKNLFVNPCSELILSQSEEILRRGPKCRLNIKLSKLDVFLPMQTIARKVNLDERVTFIDVARVTQMFLLAKWNKWWEISNQMKREIFTKSVRSKKQKQKKT